MFVSLIEQKQKSWDRDKQSSAEKMGELAVYFSGTASLSKADANY